MTPELIFGLVGLLIGILSVGAALAWLIVAGQASLRRDLGERMGMLESRMSSMETRMAAVETGVAALGTRLHGVEAGLSAVQSRLSAVETRTSEMERELGRTQGLIDGLRGTPGSTTSAD
ncbi:MAG: hypothetical protein OXR64_05970 [Chloroflexota bacterium]|nr:hypothetical protein [Chloroflexota bacterium]MDE2919378.1 hypothetical protein [Chloroflexota bacterium]